MIIYTFFLQIRFKNQKFGFKILPFSFPYLSFDPGFHDFEQSVKGLVFMADDCHEIKKQA